MTLRTSLLASVFALVLVSTAAAESSGHVFYQWTVSSSSVDPFVNESPPVDGLRWVYLWCVTGRPDDQDGVSMADLRLDLSGSATFFGAVQTLPIVISETVDVTPFAVDLSLVFSDCELPYFLAASIQVIDLGGGGGSICFEANSATARNCTANCGTPPVYFENSFIGFSSEGSAPCRLDNYISPCQPIAAEPETWGSVKGRYRVP